MFERALHVVPYVTSEHMGPGSRDALRAGPDASSPLAIGRTAHLALWELHCRRVRRRRRRAVRLYHVVVSSELCWPDGATGRRAGIDPAASGLHYQATFRSWPTQAVQCTRLGTDMYRD